MKAFEDKLDEKFCTLSTTVTTHTERSLEASTATLIHHTSNLQAFLGTIAQEFHQSNLRMQGIVNGISAAAPELLQRATPPSIPQGFTTATSPLPLQAPPGFHNNPPTYHQGPSTFNG